MRKILPLLAWLIALPWLSNAQSSSDSLSKTRLRWMWATSDIRWGSNVLNPGDVQHLVWGGPGEWSFATDAPDNSKALGHAKHRLTGPIDWVKRKSWFAEYNQFGVGYLSATGDFARVAGGGNAQFAGESADLSRSAAYYWNGHSIGLGYARNWKDVNSYASLEATLSLSSTRTWLAGQLSEGFLHTSAIGDSLHFSASGQLAWQKFAPWIGLRSPGVSTNLRLDLGNFNRNIYGRISVSNMGLFWPTENRISFDTTVPVTGIRYPDDPHPKNESLADTFGLKKNLSRSRKATLMPVDLNVLLAKKFGERTRLKLELGTFLLPIGESIRLTPPRITLTYGRKAGEHWEGVAGIDKYPFAPLQPTIGLVYFTDGLSLTGHLRGISWLWSDSARGGGANIILGIKL